MGYHGLSEIVILRPSPNTEVPMKKIYIVRLSDAERTTCLDIIKKRLSFRIYATGLLIKSQSGVSAFCRHSIRINPKTAPL